MEQYIQSVSFETALLLERKRKKSYNLSYLYTYILYLIQLNDNNNNYYYIFKRFQKGKESYQFGVNIFINFIYRLF